MGHDLAIVIFVLISEFFDEKIDENLMAIFPRTPSYFCYVNRGCLRSTSMFILVGDLIGHERFFLLSTFEKYYVHTN
jgi:hypothetical protein